MGWVEDSGEEKWASMVDPDYKTFGNQPAQVVVLAAYLGYPPESEKIHPSRRWLLSFARKGFHYFTWRSSFAKMGEWWPPVLFKKIFTRLLIPFFPWSSRKSPFCQLGRLSIARMSPRQIFVADNRVISPRKWPSASAIHQPGLYASFWPQGSGKNAGLPLAVCPANSKMLPVGE